MFIIILPGSWWLRQLKKKNTSACRTGDPGSTPGPGRCPGEGHGNPLQYCGLENPMNRGECRVQSMGSQRVEHG